MQTFYKVGFFVLLFLLILAAAGGAYYFGTLQTKPTPTPTPTKIPQPTVGPTAAEPTKKINLAELKENIKAALETKNYAALEGFMANEVSVILEATECCGPLSKAEAVAQLAYLNQAQSPWNFDQTNETIKKLKNQEPTKYGPESAFVGIAANEYVASFKFDSEGRINGITMAVTYKLVIP